MRETDRQTERQTETERQADRDKDTETETDRQADKQRRRERERERQRQRDRDRDTETEIQRQRQGQPDRDRETETARQTATERQRRRSIEKGVGGEVRNEQRRKGGSRNKQGSLSYFPMSFQAPLGPLVTCTCSSDYARVRDTNCLSPSCRYNRPFCVGYSRCGDVAVRYPLTPQKVSFTESPDFCSQTGT